MKKSSNYFMKIGEMSHLFGISIDTLRHYDRIGLLKPAVNPVNNYRYYSPNHIPLLKIIQTGKNADISLDELKQYLSSGSVDSYLKFMKRLNENIKRKRELLEQQELYCQETTALLSKINKFENDFTLKSPVVEQLDIIIYKIKLQYLNEIHVYPHTLEEQFGIEQWIIYPKDLRFSSNAPEDEQEHFFSYRKNKYTKIFEDALIQKEKEKKAEHFHFSGKYYKIEFFGNHNAISEYANYLFEHFNLSDRTELLLNYLFSLPAHDKEYKHFVAIYVPLS